MAQLTRYWITFDYPPREAGAVVVGDWTRQVGFGVTAADVDDAIAILRHEWFDHHDLDVPPIEDIVEDVDVSELPEHMRPHMNPPNWRGMGSRALGQFAESASLPQTRGLRECSAIPPDALPATHAVYVNEAAWSPDGQSVAYSMSGAGGSPPCGFYLLAAGRASRRLLTSFGDLCSNGPRPPPEFAWDPNGASLIFAPPAGTERVDIATGKRALIVKKGAYTCCWVSSDSQFIGFNDGEVTYAVSATGETFAKLRPPKGFRIAAWQRFIDVHLP